MKPFNLKAALAGEKVITRDGREVAQLAEFDCTGVFVIAAVISGVLHEFDAYGRSLGESSMPSPKDLFMASKKLSGFINIYDDYIGMRHKTRKDADDSADGGTPRMACIDLSKYEEGEGL